jgi:hypothetical protein
MIVTLKKRPKKNAKSKLNRCSQPIRIRGFGIKAGAVTTMITTRKGNVGYWTCNPHGLNRTRSRDIANCALKRGLNACTPGAAAGVRGQTTQIFLAVSRFRVMRKRLQKSECECADASKSYCEKIPFSCFCRFLEEGGKIEKSTPDLDQRRLKKSDTFKRCSVKIWLFDKRPLRHRPVLAVPGKIVTEQCV